MKSSNPIVRAILISAAMAVTAVVLAAPPQGPRYAPGVVLVEYQGEASVSTAPGRREQARTTTRQRVSAQRAEKVSPRAPNLEKLDLPAGKSVEEAIKTLSQDPNVRYAEPDYVLTKAVTSNDSYYTNGNLWGMYGDATNPVNQYGSQAGEAWARGHTGSRGVYVGVIDEGIDYNHPDLVGNVWVNPYEVPNDGIDNDGNGYVDDVNGWDFYSNDKTVYDGNGGDNHGTHVAGTIGGVGGNGAGVAGVNWQVTLISLKFLGSNGGYTSGAIAAVDYLTDLKIRHGLNVVASSNSWGGGGYSQALMDAINRGGNRDILFIAAAGNATSNTDIGSYYPSNYQCTTASRSWDCVISVASITSGGGLSSFSNYGATTVDMGAPGSAIYSTLPGNTYGSYSGTSMATPHVSGAAALCKSMNPGQTAAEIRAALLSTAAPTASLNGKTVSGGRLDVGSLADVCAAAAAPVNGTPGNLAAQAEGASAINLSWSDNSTNESYFEIQRSPAGCGSFETLSTSGANSTSYRVNNLEAETEYCFRVRAGNGLPSQSNWSSPVSALTEALPPPYQCAATAHEWVDVSGGATLSLGDEGQATVAMPFSVPFYGANSSQVVVSPNGVVRLDGGALLNAYQNTGLPMVSEPNGLVAVFWDDLNQANGGNVRVGAVGSAPNRRFVVSWEGVPHYSVSGSDITAQLVIEESTGDLVMNYADVVVGNASYDYGRSATVGVEDQAGLAGTQYLYNQAELADGTSVRCTTGTDVTPPLAPPAAPTGLSATAVSGAQVNVSWSEVVEATGYVLERAVGSTGSFAVLAEVPAGTVSYSDTAVAEGTQYQYRLLARNANGNSAYSSTASAATPATLPAMPGSVSATVSARRVTIDWTDSSSNETGFDIGRSTLNTRTKAWGAISVVSSVGANVTRLVRSESKATYRYYVRAKNGAGTSAWAGPTANIVVTSTR